MVYSNDLTKYKNFARIVDSSKDKVYKDECVYCYDTSESKDGLYVSLNTFLGFEKEHLLLYHKMTSEPLFLNIKKTLISEKLVPKVKVKKLAIGMADGFQIDEKLEYKEVCSLVILPTFSVIPIESWSEVPDNILNSINSILSAQSALKAIDLEMKNFEWDGEKRPITKHYLDLNQIPNPSPVILKDIVHCDKCEVKENLWINLTDGSILCGRKNFDGSGGNNHALENYKETKFPLAVKIGTISSEGADVYSYDEDEMVEDPNLQAHLAHFGLDMDTLTKTEKTLAELEIELNENYSEWNAIQELSGDLKPIFGPGFTGIYNLGNTCYISSVLQTVFNLGKFRNFYHNHYTQFIKDNLTKPLSDFNLQTSKVCFGLLSGKYSHPPNLENNLERHSTADLGIKPRFFNMMLKKSHPEFRNDKQQDAHEFFLHFMNQIDRHNHHSTLQPAPPKISLPPPSNTFKFYMQERLEILGGSKMVQYQSKLENYLSFVIPFDNLVNKSKYETYVKDSRAALDESGKSDHEMVKRMLSTEKIFAQVDFKDVFASYFAPEIVRRRFNLGRKSEGGQTVEEEKEASKTYAFETFPKYLLIHLKKYTFEPGSDGVWAPKKLDVSIENVPDILDLMPYLGTGIKPHEIPIEKQPSQLLRETRTLSERELDIVNQIVEMGFTENHVKYAINHMLFLVNKDPKIPLSLDNVLNWCMENPVEESSVQLPKEDAEDFPSFSTHINSHMPKNELPNNDVVVDQVNVDAIVDMGFTVQQARRALLETQNSLERAVDWLFSHPSEALGTSNPQPHQNIPNNIASFSDDDHNFNEHSTKIDSQIELNLTNSRYRLVGIISHIGTSLTSGHYVCHLKKSIDDKVLDINGSPILNSTSDTTEKWVIFNDTKVALSENPPLNFAYMYFYERID